VARARALPQKRHLRPITIEGGIEDDAKGRRIQALSKELMAIHVASHLAFRIDKKGKVIEVIKAIGMFKPGRLIGLNIYSFIADSVGALSAMKNLKHTMETGLHLHIKLNCRRLLSDRNVIPMNFVITRDTKKSAIIYCDTPIYNN
jgi:hypothetical protein